MHANCGTRLTTFAALMSGASTHTPTEKAVIKGVERRV